jgi:signal transduction histidine kinase
MRTRARSSDPASRLEQRALFELATADDLQSGMTAVVELVRVVSGATRAEWREHGELAPRVATGRDGRGGPRRPLSLGPAGSIVLVGGRCDARLESLLAAVLPVVRRRHADERLARATLRLARRNEALEEFAALVAHELKSPLRAALAEEDGSRWVRQALDLVDALIEAARDSVEPRFSAPADCLRDALRDLGPVDLEVTTDLRSTLPLPPTPLRVLLRNLLRNAVAAGAHTVHVEASPDPGGWLLVVEDNGAGLAADHHLDGGSGLGLRLCQRIARRYNGALALAPVPAGGTRAVLLVRERP